MRLNQFHSHDMGCYVWIESPVFKLQGTDVENVQGDKIQSRKTVRNGQLLIERNGKFYNAQGVEIQ